MEFSLVVLYSEDRRSQFLNSVECWGDCAGYASAQKILCVDGESDISIEGWTILKIGRAGDFFCWADSINKGVGGASEEIVVYMDSDRIVPTCWFSECCSLLSVDKNRFLYPSRLYSLKSHVGVDALREIRDNVGSNERLLTPDHRQDDPKVYGRKNPFSGCVAFGRSAFFDCGGFDGRFVGWGYPDYDFMMKVKTRGLPVIPIDASELHQRHEYAIERRMFRMHNLYNLRQYVEKWDLPRDHLERVAESIGVDRRHLYGSESLRRFLSLVNGPKLG